MCLFNKTHKPSHSSLERDKKKSADGHVFSDSYKVTLKKITH